jgi:hypothetical protein
MNMSENQPKKDDVILEGQNDRSQAPLDGVVLETLSRGTIDLQPLLQQQSRPRKTQTLPPR